MVFINQEGSFVDKNGHVLEVAWNNKKNAYFLPTGEQVTLNALPEVFDFYENCFNDGLARASNPHGHWEVGYIGSSNVTGLSPHSKAKAASSKCRSNLPSKAVSDSIPLIAKHSSNFDTATGTGDLTICSKSLPHSSKSIISHSSQLLLNCNKVLDDLDSELSAAPESPIPRRKALPTHSVSVVQQVLTPKRCLNKENIHTGPAQVKKEKGKMGLLSKSKSKVVLKNCSKAVDISAQRATRGGKWLAPLSNDEVCIILFIDGHSYSL